MTDWPVIVACAVLMPAAIVGALLGSAWHRAAERRRSAHACLALEQGARYVAACTRPYRHAGDHADATRYPVRTWGNA